MKIIDLNYEDHFYWKGIRYKQVIRPKTKHKSFIVVCTIAFGQGDWVDMPAGRKVKPVVKLISK